MHTNVADQREFARGALPTTATTTAKKSMNIKIGFDIQLAIASPMALIYLLHVHPSRQADLWAPEQVWVQPNVFAGEYLDAFGNQCGC